MIFAVSSDAETSCFDCGKTKTDGLAQGSGVDVGDVVLFADATVGEIEALSGDIPVRIGRVVSGEPGMY